MDYSGTRLAAISSLVAVALSGGCSSSSEEEDSWEPPPPVDLMCETEGYPCDYESADPEAVARSADYLAVVTERYEKGETLAQMAHWLVQQPDVEEFWTHPAGFRFRILDAPPMWFLDGPRTGPLRSEESRPMPSLSPYVVGHHEKNDNEKKHAVFLHPAVELGVLHTPWSSELETYRDYQSRVTVRVGREAGWEQFGTFRERDLVVVKTHGATMCEPPADAATSCDPEEMDAAAWWACRSSADGYNVRLDEVGPTLDGRRCEAILLTGSEVENCDLSNLGDLPTGVQCGTWPVIKPEGFPTVQEVRNGTDITCSKKTHESRLFVTSEFFRSEYKGRQRNKSFVFGGCQLFTTTSIVDAIGEKNDFIGWTQAIETEISTEAGQKYLERTIAHGETPRMALEQIEVQIGSVDYGNPYADVEPPFCSEFDENGQPLENRIRARKGGTDRYDSFLFSHFQNDDGLRVRELVQLSPPGEPQNWYTNQSEVAALVRGDRTKIQMDLLVRGIELGASPPFEFSLAPLETEVEIVDLGVVDAEKTEHRYRLVINVDDAIENPTDARLDFRVDLPEGGVTRHSADVTVGPIGACDWKFDVGGKVYRGDFIITDRTDGSTVVNVQPAGLDGSAMGSFEVEAGRGTTGTFAVDFAFTDGASRWASVAGETVANVTINDAEELMIYLSGPVEGDDLSTGDDEKAPNTILGYVHWSASGACNDFSPF